MTIRPIARLALVLAFAGASVACGGGASTEETPPAADNGGGETLGAAEPTTTEPSPTDVEPQAGAPSASAECGGYLVHYQRCEPQLAAEIAAGDRRTYESEARYVHFLEDSPEGPGMPAACASMDRDLSSVCP